jgi:hypothetical protein
MKFSVVSLVVLCLASASSAQPINSHWKQITTPKNLVYEAGISPYFINPKLGFIFQPGIIMASSYRITGYPTQLNRTTDGGQTWTSLDQFNALYIGIAQLYFVSPAHGYLAGVNFGNGGGIFETLDTGSHWSKISPGPGGFQSVYAAGGSVYATTYAESLDPMCLLVTRNDGVSWDTIQPGNGDVLTSGTMYSGVTGNKDSMIYTVRLDAASTNCLEFSTNSGRSWNTSTLDLSYLWRVTTLFSFQHSTELLREYVPWVDQLGDTYSILRSKGPPYSIWDTSLLHEETGAWVAGNSCVQYLPSANDQKPGRGVERSEDLASSWVRVDAPDCSEIDDGDFRNISVVGHGAVIYECEQDVSWPASFFCSTDGGDGTLSESQLASTMFFGQTLPSGLGNDTVIASACSPSNVLLIFQNLTCAYSGLNQLIISGLDSTEYSYTFRHHTFDQSLPDTIVLSISPSVAGDRSVTAKLQFIDDEYNTFDTSSTFVLSVTGINAVDLRVQVHLTPITGYAGDTVEIPVYISNTGSIQPTSIVGTTSGTVALTLNTNLLGSLKFTPTLAGVTSGALIVTPTSISIPLTAPNGFTFTGQTLLGNLRGVLCLTDSSHTSVTVSQSTFTSADPRCIVESLDSNAIQITVGRRCGDSTLLHYMVNGQLPFDILGITPNPASNLLQVVCTNRVGAELSYQLFDALGKERLNGSVKGMQTTLDVSILPEGTYFFRMSDLHGNALTRTIGVIK